jgi:hypothetical protein
VIFWTIVNFDKIGHPVTKDSPPIIITREIPCPLIDKETDKEYGGNIIEYNSESGVIIIYCSQLNYLLVPNKEQSLL